MPSPSVTNWRSYRDLLRDNPRYRRFWLAGVISQLGNWFNYIAVFVLLTNLGGGGGTVSWFLIAKFLPTTIFGPAAGVLADRFSRKAIMIAADLTRIGVVLAFLAVRRPEQIWLVYLLAVAQETLWTFFDPARRASTPNLVSRAQLPLANALSGATWSVLLALGAALGGLTTALWGWRTAIVVDAATFALSAAILATIDLPQTRPSAQERPRSSWRQLSGWEDIQAGYRYLRHNPEVARIMLVKSGWALSGGILVMLTVFGEQVFRIGGHGGGSGLFYSFRGIGAAIGPILAWRLLGDDTPAMYRGIAAAFFISSGAYLAFSMAPHIAIALPLVLVGHIGGSIQWVFSTTLLQQMVPDYVRGRVLAAEMALLTLVLSLSTLATGQALDAGLGPRPVTAALALLFLLPGLFWLLQIRRKRLTPPSGAAPPADGGKDPGQRA